MNLCPKKCRSLTHLYKDSHMKYFRSSPKVTRSTWKGGVEGRIQGEGGFSGRATIKFPKVFFYGYARRLSLEPHKLEAEKEASSSKNGACFWGAWKQIFIEGFAELDPSEKMAVHLAAAQFMGQMFRKWRKHLFAAIHRLDNVTWNLLAISPNARKRTQKRRRTKSLLSEEKCLMAWLKLV